MGVADGNNPTRFFRQPHRLAKLSPNIGIVLFIVQKHVPTTTLHAKFLSQPHTHRPRRCHTVDKKQTSALQDSQHDPHLVFMLAKLGSSVVICSNSSGKVFHILFHLSAYRVIRHGDQQAV